MLSWCKKLRVVLSKASVGIVGVDIEREEVHIEGSQGEVNAALRELRSTGLPPWANWAHVEYLDPETERWCQFSTDCLPDEERELVKSLRDKDEQSILEALQYQHRRRGTPKPKQEQEEEEDEDPYWPYHWGGPTR